VKRSTVIRHLTGIAEQADHLASVGTAWQVAPLAEIWVAGDLLDEVELVESVSAVLMIDVPADELPVLAIHPDGQVWAWNLELSKRPLLPRYEPATRPAWNHERRRVLRFWSSDDGLDEAAVDSLRSPPLDAAPIVSPTPAELRQYLETELPRSSAHLRRMLDDYWDGDWRKSHTDKANWIHPDDHLWRAAYAVQSMQDALAELDGGEPETR
jgi:hypothetical protein